MKKILAAAIAYACCVSIAFCELTQKESLMLRELSVMELKATLKKIKKELLLQQEQPRSTKLRSFFNEFKIYTIHPFASADTGIQKQWFASVLNLLKQMAEIKSRQELAIGVRNVKAYRNLAKLYANDYSRFVAYVKKPVMVGKSELKRLRRTARLKRRALERKANL